MDTVRGHTGENLPGVGGVDPREFEDLEFSRLSMLEELLVLLEEKKIFNYYTCLVKEWITKVHTAS